MCFSVLRPPQTPMTLFIRTNTESFTLDSQRTRDSLTGEDGVRGRTNSEPEFQPLFSTFRWLLLSRLIFCPPNLNSKDERIDDNQRN